MTQGYIFFFLLTLFSCGNQETKTNAKPNSNESNHISASISIPQNSGLAYVSYKKFIIEDSEFSEIISSPNINLNLDSTEIKKEGWSWDIDTIATFSVSIDHQIKLKKLIEKSDSLGEHIAEGCTDFFGWPRFYISASCSNINLNGFIANCYRQHIFEFVDILNECYPEGDALSYDKEELITKEKRCNENNYGKDK